MSENIFSKQKKLQEIFKDERFLYPEFVPEKLPHRDSEIDSLVYSLKPVLSGKKPENVFVTGESGTGKTVTVKFVLNELHEYSDRAKSLYVNCFEFNTRHAVLSAVTNFLGNPVPRRGVATDEVYSRLLSSLKSIDFTPIIVLDEVDQLFADEEASKLFYDLLRVVEYGKHCFGLIFISNDSELTAKFDSRVKSSLASQTIVFQKYSPQQLKDILNERCQYAFHSSKLESEVINVAAGHAAKLNGDARVAIECLLKAGREAERENAGKVSLEHLKKAFLQLDSTALKKTVKFLKENQKIILKILIENDSMNSGELYERYSKQSKEPLTLRRFRDLVNELEKFDLIKMEDAVHEIKGRTRKISLKVPKNLLQNELSQLS